MYYDLSPTKREEIAKLTSDLLKQQNEYVTTNLDVVIDEIADVDLYFADFDAKISGYIQKDEDDDWDIFINKNYSQEKQIFTTAHELGHYFLHLKNSDEKEWLDFTEMYRHLLPYSEAEKVMEDEADYFASCLLMPEYKVKKAWDAYPNISHCAQMFCVSEGAMYYRLQEFSLVE